MYQVGSGSVSNWFQQQVSADELLFRWLSRNSRMLTNVVIRFVHKLFTYEELNSLPI